VSWCDFGDDVFGYLFDHTAGNPFFTKLICGTLYQDLVKKRDSHATLDEAVLAVKNTVRAAGPNKFQHFWEDGIRERGARQEVVSLRRRKVLIGVARALAGESTATEVISACAGAELTEVDIRAELDEFHRRKVLLCVGDNISCSVPLFEMWLRERGVRDIITTVTDPGDFFRQKEADDKLRITSQELVALVKDWPPYHGAKVGEERVRAWLEQFPSVEQRRTMFRLLSGVTFVSEARVRSLATSLHAGVERELVTRSVPYLRVGKQRKRQDLLVCYAGSDGKSGNFYARIYAEHNRLLVDRVVEINNLSKALEGTQEIGGILIVDDFIGSGGTMAQHIRDLPESVCELIRDRKLPIVVAGFLGLTSAVPAIQSAGRQRALDISIVFGDPLNDSQRAFTETSLVFPDPKERAIARELAQSIGRRLVPKNPLGYGACEALVVFERQCPNNSLPILWKSSDKEKWTALFPRDL
jgi:hypothetical protein